MPQDQKQAFVQKVVDTAMQNKQVSSVNASVDITNEWRYSRVQRRLVHRAGDVGDNTDLQRLGAASATSSSRATTSACRGPAAGKLPEEAGMLESAVRIADEAVEMTTRRSRSAWG